MTQQQQKLRLIMVACLILSTFSSLYSQVIDSKQYNYVGNWYRWQGGSFITNLNLPKVTATTGRDTGAIRYALADSSIYVWTGSQWRQVTGSGGGAVSSVFGRTGAVTALEADYNAFYPLLSGTYNNPSWLNQLAWSKITGTPTTLAGYGITDGGEVNTGSNVGGGAEVFKQKTGVDFVHRTLLGTNGITVTQNTNDITISGNADSSAARVRTGTYAQRVAIASPVIGDVFTQTDRLKGIYFYNGDYWEFKGSPLEYMYYNQFNGGTNQNVGYNMTLGQVVSGAGAGAALQNLSGTDAFVNYQTGTTSGGHANTNFMGGNNLTNMIYDSLIVYTEYKIQIPTLSDGTDRFQIAVGATTSTSSYNFPAFVFYYSDNNNSGQWSTITRAHNSGSLTIKNTSVAVTAGAWVKLAIEIDSYADQIKFYIDDVLVQTHTSVDNTPLNGAITWGVNSGYGHAGILKIVGTTSRSMYLNYAFAYITKRKY